MENIIEIQYEYNGEWFEIWETNETDLELAWKEIDEQSTEGGNIRFQGSKDFLVVNGGLVK